MVTLVNIMVMNGWLTSFLFHVNRPSHSWDKAISDFDLEISTPGSRSYNQPSVILTHFVFIFTSIRPTIPELELFRNLTLKHPRSRSWVRSKVKVTYCTQYPTDAFPFRFTSIRPTIPEIWPAKITFDLEKIHPNFLKKICQNKGVDRTSPKSNQVIIMSRAIALPCFVVIRWVVLTLSRRQANFC